MPRKLRDLISDLTDAGFTMQPGKGSHRKFNHPKGQVVILSGHNTGVDAKHYQEKQVRAKIQESKKQ